VSAPADASHGAARFELFATLLLALAAVATAWSGYQASRWNGEQAKATARASAARIDSTKAADLANAQSQIDVATFTQWVDAYAREEGELARFYRRRFRPEFKPAVAAWIATRPLKNPRAPLTPFAMPQYRVAAREQSAVLQARGERMSALARSYIQRSTNYVLAAVLFATVLFFAGLSTKLRTQGLRVLMLGLGATIFAVTVIWVATSPVSLSV